MSQKTLALFLKTLVLLTAALLALTYGLLLRFGQWVVADLPELAPWYLPSAAFLTLTAAIVYVILFLAFRIFHAVGEDASFTIINATRLKYIAYLFLADTLLYCLFAGIAIIGNAMHPGVLLGILCIVFIGLSLTVISAALSHMVQKAALLNEESQWTI